MDEIRSGWVGRDLTAPQGVENRIPPAHPQAAESAEAAMA